MKRKTKTSTSTQAAVPWTQLRDTAIKNLHARRKGHETLVLKFYDRRHVLIGSTPTLEQAIRHVLDHATGQLTHVTMHEAMSGKSPKAYVIADGSKVFGFDPIAGATDVVDLTDVDAAEKYEAIVAQL